MTCREFKHSAAALTLWELGRVPDDSILSHAAGCDSCGAWLGKQRSLASSLRPLQTESAGLGAGPRVEQALLKEFRRTAAARAAVVPAGVASHSEPVPEADARFTPLAIRLSRFFEIGAYAAVAAAIGVGVFLGTHLLQRSKTQPAQTAASPASLMPAAQKPVTAEPAELAAATESSAVEPPAAVHNPIQRQPSPAAKPTTVAAQPAAEVATSNADEGYIALMFCDPLSCGSDSQVVRMELPSPAGQDSQPQIADVVVGYDGVVRAVRIVN